jgi:hypothetical protein
MWNVQCLEGRDNSDFNWIALLLWTQAEACTLNYFSPGRNGHWTLDIGLIALQR